MPINYIYIYMGVFMIGSQGYYKGMRQSAKREDTHDDGVIYRFQFIY